MSGDPILAYANKPCACRFTREQDFGLSKPVEWCGFHATLWDNAQSLLLALDPQEPLFAAYGMPAVEAYNTLSKFMAEHARVPDVHPKRTDSNG